MTVRQVLDNATAGGQIEARAKALQVIDLVLASSERKLSDALAQQAGYADRSGAWRAVQELLARAESAAAKEYRDRLNGSLDVLVPAAARRLLEAMLEGEPDTIAKLTVAYVRLADRQARLNGADAPVKVEVSDDWDARIRDLLTQMDTLPATPVVVDAAP